MGNLSDVIENRDVAPQNYGDFEPLPPGKYRAHIINSEVKTTAKGGLMLKCEWLIMDSGYEGRKVWNQFNIVNDSEKAQVIGRGQLSSLARACGKVGIPEDSTELHEIQHIIKVGIESSLGYPDKNVIKGYFTLDGHAPEKAPPTKLGNVEQVSLSDDVPDFLK